MLKKKNIIKSPCIHVCTLDDEKICFGCYRSAEEIRGWNTMTDEQKIQVLVNTEKRRRAKDAINYDHYA